MQIWPATTAEDQTKWLYFSLASVLTCVFGYFAWVWLGYIMAMFWASLFLWDLVIGPMVMKDWNTDELLTEEDEWDAAFGQFMTGEHDKLVKEIEKLKTKVTKLEGRGDTGTGRGEHTITDLINRSN